MTRLLWLTFYLFITLPVNVIAADRIEMGETAIQGSRELPKVLYIVPWKSARLGLLQGGAGSSSFDTAFEALDREVFRRQIGYYGTLYGSGGQTTASKNIK